MYFHKWLQSYGGLDVAIFVYRQVVLHCRVICSRPKGIADVCESGSLSSKAIDAIVDSRLDRLLEKRGKCRC